MSRTILLIDMNSFFASVHQALDPSLKGKPVIVCGDPEKRHGIVLAASYEAKKHGVKTGMGNWEARKVLPRAVYIRPSYPDYFAFSNRIINILKNFSPLVEPFSIDEAFVDATGCEELFGSGESMARTIKAEIKTKADILCSVGVGPNKLLAKMAADMQKPDGLTVLTMTDVPARLWPLPLEKLFGIGSRTRIKLNRLNLWTIGDLARCDVNILKGRFGVIGQVLHLSANGVDYSPVDPNSLDEVKGIGHQLTLPRDYRGYDQIKVALLDLCELVSRRARLGGYAGKTISLSLTDPNRNGLSRSRTMDFHTDLTEDIFHTALQLLHLHWPPELPVRLVGVSITNLIKKSGEQLDLMGEKEKLRRLTKACDLIKNRYGESSLLRASTLTKEGIINVRQQIMGGAPTPLPPTTG
ncbi:MAG: DNA polymerase IV [Clostridia bacterium]|nr:DNA polymerase IV [Clostridia bacterium]